MNIVYFSGGLGNQMFQYALYKSLEMQGRSKVRGNIMWYTENQGKRGYELETVFPNVSLLKDDKDSFSKREKRYLKARKGRMWVARMNYCVPMFCIYFSEKEFHVFDERVFKLRHAAIRGFWQTERYFKEIREQLRTDFAFQYGEERLDFLKNRFLEDEKTVAVHIRRGDYLKHSDRYGTLSESQYYARAMAYMADRIHTPHFVFFSDDIPWVKEHYAVEGALYIGKEMFERYEPWYDMCLMSCCANNIIANSSFGWWGAWLNPNESKVVVAPKVWVVGKETKDVWCEGWVVM